LNSVLVKRNSEECVPATQRNRNLTQRVEPANADEGSLLVVAHTGNVRNELHCESGQAETLLPRYRLYESPPVKGGIQAARSQQQHYPESSQARQIAIDAHSQNDSYPQIAGPSMTSRSQALTVVPPAPPSFQLSATDSQKSVVNNNRQSVCLPNLS